MTSSVPAMTPTWIPSFVVPSWMSSTSLRSATRNRSHELWVEGGEHSRIGDKAQRRAVRSPPVVVRDGPRGRVGTVAVPQPRKDLAQFLAREEEEEHHRIGLLGDLVSVGVVALRTQDPVEPLDVPVLRAVGVPVEFFEVAVTLELADDSILEERHEHPAAHVLPQPQLIVTDA